MLQRTDTVDEASCRRRTPSSDAIPRHRRSSLDDILLVSLPRPSTHSRVNRRIVGSRRFVGHSLLLFLYIVQHLNEPCQAIDLMAETITTTEYRNLQSSMEPDVIIPDITSDQGSPATSFTVEGDDVTPEDDHNIVDDRALPLNLADEVERRSRTSTVDLQRQNSSTGLLERSRQPVMSSSVLRRSRPRNGEGRRQSRQSSRRSASSWSRLDDSNVCNFSKIIDLIDRQSLTNRPESRDHESPTSLTCGSFFMSLHNSHDSDVWTNLFLLKDNATIADATLYVPIHVQCNHKKQPVSPSGEGDSVTSSYKQLHINVDYNLNNSTFGSVARNISRRLHRHKLMMCLQLSVTDVLRRVLTADNNGNKNHPGFLHQLRADFRLSGVADIRPHVMLSSQKNLQLSVASGAYLFVRKERCEDDNLLSKIMQEPLIIHVEQHPSTGTPVPDNVLTTGGMDSQHYEDGNE